MNREHICSTLNLAGVFFSGAIKLSTENGEAKATNNVNTSGECNVFYCIPLAL